jgi:beta-lactamase regulating signal transducer with metallopeptidase domain
MIGLSTIQSLAQFAGARLITGLAAGLVLAILTALALRVFRTSSTRFAFCFVALLGIAVLPLAACFLGHHAVDVRPAQGIVIPVRWALGLLGFWIAGACIGLSRIAVGLWRVRQIRQRCLELETGSSSEGSGLGKSDPELKLSLTEFGAKRKVALCISDEVSVPTAVGFFRPAILLPSWSTRELSASELKSVLLHELGHLRRWDDWTNLAQKFLQALLFFHPAVWWIDSRLALEREAACDDLVVEATRDARGYASCLVSIAEKRVGRRAFALAVAAVNRVRETAVRLTRILDQNRPQGNRVSKPALATFATLTLALLVEMPRVPSIVQFRDTTRAAFAQQTVPAPIADTQSVPTLIPASAHVETGSREEISRPMLRKAELRTGSSSGSEVRARTNLERAKRPQVNRVRTDHSVRRSPAFVQTSWEPKSSTRIRNQQNAGPTLFLLTQTVVCDEYGNCFVSVRAWQVLTLQQTKAQTQNGNSSKSI